MKTMWLVIAIIWALCIVIHLITGEYHEAFLTAVITFMSVDKYVTVKRNEAK